MRNANYLALLAGMLFAQSLAAQSAAEEYRVKGAFLLNFTRFVEWPEQSLGPAGQSFYVCMLGTSPFSADLNRAAQGYSVAGHPVALRQISDARSAAECRIVFLCGPQKKSLHELADIVQRAGVLTVGESDGFVAAGGMIGFRLEDSRVRMEIGTEAAKRAGLRISAKLLSLAAAR